MNCIGCRRTVKCIEQGREAPFRRILKVLLRYYRFLPGGKASCPLVPKLSHVPQMSHTALDWRPRVFPCVKCWNPSALALRSVLLPISCINYRFCSTGIKFFFSSFFTILEKLYNDRGENGIENMRHTNILRYSIVLITGKGNRTPPYPPILRLKSAICAC